MILETIVTGYIEENCYLAGDENELLVIDPGDDSDKILKRINDSGYKVKYIVLTHCHYDHIGAVAEIKEKTGTEIVVCEKEKANYLNPDISMMGHFGDGKDVAEPDITVSEGDELISGKYSFKIIETPGHTSGGMCLLCDDVLFSGDTLFRRGIGRVDLPTGSMKQIINSIKNKLFMLPDETRVYCGHGPATTIEYEKKHNEIYEWERYYNGQ